MIPRKIHYCWFGLQDKPASVLKCIESWRKTMPDYEIKEWNEDNFMIAGTKFTLEAYKHGLYAFVSDYVRLKALVEEGGIYFDTDVEVLKPFDEFLSNQAFMGFEGEYWIGTSVIGAEKGHPYLKRWLDSYADKKFMDETGRRIATTNVHDITGMLSVDGLVRNGQQQQVKGITIYPTDYFTPYDYLQGKLRKTPNTHSIHWFSQSWLDKKTWRTRLSHLYHRFVGVRM